jgi:tripartite ATP-independent transporter DctP family solute receptor
MLLSRNGYTLNDSNKRWYNAVNYFEEEEMRKTLVTVSILLIAAAILFPAAVFAGGGKEAPAGKTAVEKPKDALKVAISHTSSLESPWQKASLKFAEIVNGKTGGRYNVEVFGNGVLCQRNWKIMLEMTQAGSSQIGIESVTALASIVPEIGALGLPFLFENIEHVINFLDTNPPVWKQWLYDGFEKQNLVVLSITPRPFRQLNNNKKIVKTPEDIKDMRFRVPNTPLFVKIFEALGAKPVPLSSGEIYTAIQLGTVVGEDNSIPVQYDFKTHEVAKNFTIWNYIADASILFINKDIWNKMSDADKAAYKEAAKVWGETNIKQDTDYTVVARQNMEKAGVNFYEMKDAEKTPFKKLVEPVYADMAKNVGEANFKAYMDAVQKTKK